MKRRPEAPASRLRCDLENQRLVENELVAAGAQHYRLAARRLAKMRTLSAGAEKSAEVNDLVADLRKIHRRRPRLQQEFDRAGLP